MKLTDQDIKTIKYEKRFGIVFPLMIIVFFGGMLNMFYFTDSEMNLNWFILVLVNIGIVIFNVFISLLINKKYNQDLKSQQKIIKIETVESKEDETNYEVGSGALYIPILGDLFPNYYGQKMKPINKLNLIINNTKYEIGKTIYDKIKNGDSVEMHYSKYSETLLSIELINKKSQATTKAHMQ